MPNPLIDGLREALSLTPNNIALRKHLADLLLQEGEVAEAEKEYRQVLLLNPHDETVKFGLAQGFFQQEKWMMALVILEELAKMPNARPEVLTLTAEAYAKIGQQNEAQRLQQQADAQALAQTPVPTENVEEPIAVPVEDWVRPNHDGRVERSKITFKDVGGMDKIKEQIRLKIIHPLNHPEIYKAYGKSIGGGILLYGPPGCGKTHLARATAGEVNAAFISMGIHDVLNMYLGQSEHNLHGLFELARSNRPCVLFIDEIDALGASRTDMRQSAGRHLINQLLSEMDGIDNANDGLLILAATNAPWHLDSALLRPGRFDRIIFVPPPDSIARGAILEVLLREKPVSKMDFEQIAKKTEGFSGADLKGLIDQAIEMKLEEAIKKGVPSPLESGDLLKSAKRVKPSTKDWFATARNYAVYANQSGLYDEILDYLGGK